MFVLIGFKEISVLLPWYYEKESINKSSSNIFNINLKTQIIILGDAMFKNSIRRTISIILVFLVLLNTGNFNVFAAEDESDITPPLLETVTIKSDNPNEASAKVGDTVTVSITANENLRDKPVINIGGNEADVSGSGKNWQGSYRMRDGDEEGQLYFSVQYQDIAGNSGSKVTTVTDGSKVIFDNTKPVINLNGSSEITIPVNSDYSEAATAHDNIDKVLTSKIIKSGTVQTSTVGTYYITYSVKDSAGNEADSVTRTIHVQPIAVNSTVSGIVGNIPKAIPVAKFFDNYEGDTLEHIKITALPASGKLRLNGAELSEGQVIAVADLKQLNLNQLNYTPLNFSGRDFLRWEGIGQGDVYSNEAVISLEVAENANPGAPGVVKGLTEGQRVKGGTKLNLSWTPSVDDDNEGFDIAYILEFFDGSQWKEIYRGTNPSYIYDADSELNIGNARFRVKGVDEGGLYSSYSYSEVFTLDNTAPVLSNVKIKSSGGALYAKSGDKITLTFASSEPLFGTPVVMIDSKSAEVTGEGNSWTAVYTMTAEEEEGTVLFWIDFTDCAGIPGIRVTTTSDASQIIYDRTKPVISLSGDAVMNLEVPAAFTDPGVEVTDNMDSLIADGLVKTGTVDNENVGTYKIRYNVTDAAGNKADEVMRTVNIKDSVKPEIKLDRSEITIEVHTAYDDTGVTATDNYDTGIAGRLVVENPVNKDKTGKYVITYNVTDCNGNKADEVKRTVYVVDTTAPVLKLNSGAAMTIEVGSSFDDPGYTVTDNYDDVSDITPRVAVSGSVNIHVVGEYTINYNVSDSSGNKAAQATRTVYVVDSELPALNMTGGDAVIEVHSAYIDGGATATDNYDGDITSKIVVNNQVKANVVGTYYVTYDVKDSNGNSAVQIKRKVTVQDKTKPVITLKGVSLGGNSDVTLQVHGTYTDATAKASATATDNYDGNLSGSITVDNTVIADETGTYLVTFYVTDSNGNEAIPVTRKVHVVDTEKPVIHLNGQSTIEIPLGTAYTDEKAYVTDNYDPNRTITGTGSVNTEVVGTYTITFTAADSSGNAADTTYRTVRVKDVTKPVITLTGSTELTIEVHGKYTEQGFWADDPDDGILTDSVVVSNPVIVDKVGDYTITYNVTEPHGNKADQVTRLVHVVDRTPPVITLKGTNINNGNPDFYIEVKTEYTDPGFTATDNYDGDLTPKVHMDVSGVNMNELGTYQVRYNVEDERENKAVEVSRNIHVQDTIKPVLLLKGDAVMTVPQGQFVDPGVTATDNYETEEYLQGNLVKTQVDWSIPGMYVIVYNVADSSGNAAKAVMRTVYVVGGGGEGPEITVSPSEVTVEVKTSYELMTGVSAQPASGASITAINVSGTVSLDTVGDYAVLYTAVQDNGASYSKSRIIHVVDTTSPVLALKGEAEVTIDVHTAYSDAGAEATDNYDSPSALQIYSKNGVVINKVGTYKVKYNVTDENGNKATEIERTVHVVDRKEPVITLLGAAELTLEAKSVFNDPGAVATDNYDKSCPVLVSPTLDMNTWGDYTLTYTATDANGNSADEKTRIIHVRDTKGPVITLNEPGTLTLEVHNEYNDPGASAFDSYDGAACNVLVNTSALNVDVLGTYTIAYTAKDAHNNPTTAYRTVKVVDTTKPVITLKGETPVKLEVHSRYTDAGATASDNYDGDITDDVFVVNPVIVDVVAAYTVTYSVKDGRGNADYIERIVNIVDETRPVITLIGNSQVTIPLNSAYNDAGATATDNYDGDISNFVDVESNVDASKVGTYYTTYNVTDKNHNTALQVTRTVYVQPVAGTLNKDGVQNAPIKFTLDEFAQKVNGEAITEIKILTLPSNGTLKNGSAYVKAGDVFDNSNTGNLRYIPNTGRMGKDSFSWTGVGASGIWSNKTTVNFDIKVNYAPSIPGDFTGLLSGQLVRGGTEITIGWGTASDPDGNLGEPIDYILEFYDGAVWTELAVQQERDYTVTLSEVNTTAAKFRVKSRDAGGMESTYKNSVNFEIDSATPVLNSVTIKSNNARANYAKTGDTITLSFTASEALKNAPGVMIAGQAASVTGSGISWTASYKMTGTDVEEVIKFTVAFEDVAGNSGVEVNSTTDQSMVTFDRTAPVITVIGSEVTITYGSTYTDAGATAVDTLDGDISSSISRSSPTNSVGTYTITYNVKDKAGNSAVQKTRTVIVRPKVTNGSKSGIENITKKFALADFTALYANDTLSKVTITQLPGNGTLYVKSSAVAQNAAIARADLDSLSYVPQTGFTGMDSFVWKGEGNKGISSLEAAMSITIVKNNPPTVPQNVSGVSQNQKVKGGNKVTISWTASTDNDNDGAALNYVLEFSENGTEWKQVYTGTATAFEAALPVIDKLSAQFRVKAVDAGGFESDYGCSKTFIIDSTAPELINISITSNNKNNWLAKAQDSVIVSFEADEELAALPEVAIDGRSATVTGSGIEWTAVLVMSNTDLEGELPILINFKDIAGNEGSPVNSTTDQTKVIFDRTSPVITLKGSEKELIKMGDTYTDKGAGAQDSRDMDISENITAEGEVDTSLVGHYTVTYNVADSAGNIAAAVIRDVYVQPAAEDGNVEALESITYYFKQSDIASRVKGDSINSIRISDLPVNGILSYNGSPVTAGDDISEADISKLTYITKNRFHGMDGFNWTAIGPKGIRSTTARMVIHVEENFPPSKPGAFEAIAPFVKGGTPVTAKFSEASDSDGDGGIPIRYILEFTRDGESWNEIYTGTNTDFVHNTGTINTEKAQYRVKAVDGANLESDYTYSNKFTIDSERPVIELKGLAFRTLEVNRGSFSDEGVELSDNIDTRSSLEAALEVTGTVSVNELGDYTITYRVTDRSGNEAIPVTRVILVRDREKPVLTLKGAAEIVVELHGAYEDEGVTAADNYDLPQDLNIVTDNRVDTGIVGDYIITYDVTDSNGNKADTVTRAVHVQDNTPLVNSDYDDINIGYNGSDNAGSVTLNVILKNTGVSGSAITWQSNDTGTISNTGTVTRPEYSQGDKTVKLTATISKGGISRVKEFVVKVIKKSPPPTVGSLPNIIIDIPKVLEILEKNEKASDQTTQKVVDQIKEIVSEPLDEIKARPLNTELNSRKGAAEIDLGTGIFEVRDYIKAAILAAMGTQASGADIDCQLNMRLVETETSSVVFKKDKVTNTDAVINVNELKDYTWYTVKVDIVVNGKVVGTREKKILTPDRTPPEIKAVIIKK